MESGRWPAAADFSEMLHESCRGDANSSRPLRY